MTSVYNIEVTVAARNLASSVLNKIGQDAIDLNKTIAGIGEGFGVAGAALAVSGGILFGLEEAVSYAKELVHQQALYANAISNTPGATPDDTAKQIAEDTKQAWQTTNEVITSTVADNLKSIRELMSVFGSEEEARMHLTFLTKAKSVMDSILGHDAGDQVFAMAKALEIKGVSQDPAHFDRLIDAMVRATEAFGGKITGSDFMSTFKYGRTATQGWDDTFVASFLPTLMQELKAGGGNGGSAGTGLMSAFQAVVGGQMTNKAAEEWFRIGILKGDHIIRTKTGSVKGVRPGGMAGASEFQTDPYEWVQHYLMPALAAKGITSQDAIREEVAHLFGNRTAQQIMTMFATMQSRFEKDAQVAAGAANVNSAYNSNVGKDPDTQISSFHAAIDGLMSSLGAPIVLEATNNAVRLGNAIRDITNWSVGHPELIAYIDHLAASIAVFGGKGADIEMIVHGVHSVGDAFTWLANHLPSLPSWLGGSGAKDQYGPPPPPPPLAGRVTHGPNFGKQSSLDTPMVVHVANADAIGRAISGGMADGTSRPSSGPSGFDYRFDGAQPGFAVG